MTNGKIHIGSMCVNFNFCSADFPPTLTYGLQTTDHHYGCTYVERVAFVKSSTARIVAVLPLDVKDSLSLGRFLDGATELLYV